jgi:transposase
MSQLSLYVYVSHLNLSLLNVTSQEVVSPLKVSYSLVEDWIFRYRDALVLSHMRGTFSKLTPKSLMLCIIRRIWEQ